eukprot:3556586-Rhodomonas_salina.1
MSGIHLTACRSVMSGIDAAHLYAMPDVDIACSKMRCPAFTSRMVSGTGGGDHDQERGQDVWVLSSLPMPCPL